MSFMPSPGTIVRLLDGRIALMSGGSPDGSQDRALFADGHEEPTDPWQIAEILVEQPRCDPTQDVSVDALRAYLASVQEDPK